MPRVIFNPIKVSKGVNWNHIYKPKKIIHFRSSNPGTPQPRQRFPAKYDNKSREDYIEEILKNY